MPMDMMEFEITSAESSIASRGTAAQFSHGNSGTSAEQPRSFLCKRMEIEFAAVADLIADDASGSGTIVNVLTLASRERTGTLDTIAEFFDARFDDRTAHQGVIWSRPYIIRPTLVDDADNVAFSGVDAVFKTSKSFSKGFRFDKDEKYEWAIFNPLATATDFTSTVYLHVRYWGVYLE